MKSRSFNIVKTYFCQKINGGYLVACKDDLDNTLELIFSNKEFERTLELLNQNYALRLG